MYNYKLVNNDDFKKAYKKYFRKNILKGSLILISIVNIIMLIVLFLFLVVIYKLKITMFIGIASLVLVLESLVFYKSYKKEVEKILNSISDGEMDISFDEKGISLYHDSISKDIDWNAVKEIVVDESNLIFHYKTNGLTGNFFYLKFFDVRKEELIKDIEQYIKVKGC